MDDRQLFPTRPGKGLSARSLLVLVMGLLFASFAQTGAAAQGVKARVGFTSVTIISNGCVASGWADGILPEQAIKRAVTKHISGELEPSQINTDLMTAVVKNDVPAVDDLIAKKVDLDERSPEMGCTALIWAAAFKRHSIMDRLLKAGATVDLTDAAGRTPLMIAAKSGELPTVKRLAEAGADINKRQTGGINEVDRTPLIYAAHKAQNAEVIRYLVEKGAEVNAVQEHGRSALMIAAWYGHADNLRYLLSAGADRNLRDKFGRTALDHAKQFKKKNAIEVLEQR